jgi:hypothetical protein
MNKQLFAPIDESNFALYAAQHYINPRILNIDEFNEDLDRFKYLKKLINQYVNKGDLQERLISNHLICIYNVFDYRAATRLCLFKIDPSGWSTLKTFLLYHNYIHPDDLSHIASDLFVVKRLKRL